MSAESRNVAILKQAYDSWLASKGKSVNEWIDLCDANIAFGSLANGTAAKANYLTGYSTRDALTEYFAGIERDWEMLAYNAQDYIAQGDRVVVLLQCEWRHRRTGKVVTTPKADIWRLNDGKAVEYYEFYDTAQVHAAVA